MSKAKKPTYRFIFPDETRAKKFLKFASAHSNSTIAQHPLSSNGRGARICDEVLVTGSGSTLFDSNLKQVLIKKCEELDGNFMPSMA